MKVLTEDDEGKRVVDGEGRIVGVVASVRAGTAYVDTDPGVASKVRSMLGWDVVDRGDYRLDGHRIETVTDGEVRLRQ